MQFKGLKRNEGVFLLCFLRDYIVLDYPKMRFIMPLLLAVILLSGVVNANNDTLRVQGAILYKIYYLPYTSLDNISFEDLSGIYSKHSNYDNIPCSEIYDRSNDGHDLSIRARFQRSELHNLLDRTADDTVGCSFRERGSTICNNHFIECLDEDITFTYDGFWLIGSKRILKDKEENLTSFEVLINLANSASTDITDKKDKIKGELKLSQPDYDVLPNVLFIQHIFPDKLSVENFRIKYNEAVVIPHEEIQFYDQLCDYLSCENCNLLAIEYKHKEGNDRYIYFIRNKGKISSNNLGKLIISKEVHDLEFSTDLLHDLFVGVSYLRYVGLYAREYTGDLEENTTSLINQIKSSRERILNAHGNISCLEDMRVEVIDRGILDIEAINPKLKKLEGFYDGLTNRGVIEGRWEDIGFLVYHDEIEARSGEIRQRIDGIRDDLSLAEKIHEDVKQLYYSELEASRAKEAILQTHGDSKLAIEKAHRDNSIMVIIGVLTAVFTIILSLSILSLQITSDRYTPKILDYYTERVKILDKTIPIKKYGLMPVLLFVTIVFLILISYFVPHNISIVISFIFLVLCPVILVYHFRTIIELIDPTKLIGRLEEYGLGDISDEKTRELIEDLSGLSLQLKHSTLRGCIKTIAKIGQKESISADTSDFISSKLMLIGERIATDRTKIEFCPQIISGICTIGKCNIDRFKESDCDWLTGNIVNKYIKRVWENIKENKESNMLNLDSMLVILNSMRGFADKIIPVESLKGPSMDIIDFMDQIAIGSKDIPKIKQKYNEIRKSWGDMASDLYSKHKGDIKVDPKIIDLLKAKSTRSKQL